MITIIPNSPLQYSSGTGSTSYYLNDPKFDSRLFFTSTGNTLYYAVIRDTNVITSGKLSGHFNTVNYDYRFDFNNYINIDNQEDFGLKKSLIDKVIGQTEYIDYSENGFDTSFWYVTCNLYFIISTNEIINTNLTAGNLIKLDDGNVTLVPPKTANDLICDQYLNLLFEDRINDNEDVFFNSKEYHVGDKWIMTTYRAITLNKIYILKKDGTILRVSVSGNIHMILISENISSIYFTIINKEGIEVTYTTNILPSISNNCYNGYYYINKNGMFDMLKCTGSKKEVDTVTKKNIKIGNKVIQTNIKNIKQIKQNTGFGLTEYQINSLIETPFIYVIDDSKLLLLPLNVYVYEYGKKYIVENNSFTGYNGVKLSGKNIELTLTDPKQYQRKTNYKLNFFEQ